MKLRPDQLAPAIQLILELRADSRMLVQQVADYMEDRLANMCGCTVEEMYKEFKAYEDK